jgi:hypothetical protein
MAVFEIDGEEYEIPALDSFSLAECELMYDVAGVRQEDFEPADPTWDDAIKVAHALELERIAMLPAFKRALAEVAYLRRHPEVEAELRSTLVGGANALEVTIALILGGAEISDPSTSSPNELENVSSIKPRSRSEATGSRSGSDSTEPETPLAATGISGSDT